MLTFQFFHLLLLIIVANSSPVLARDLLKDKFNLPIDFFLRLPDKNPVFGVSKTWRGIISAILMTSLVAWLLGYSFETGLIVAVFAMIGDLVSSFIKRRMGMNSSSMAPLIDQLPESLLPAWMKMSEFNLDFGSAFLLVVFFIIIELVFSRVFYILGIRKRPY